MITDMDSLKYNWWRAEFDREATLRAHAAMPSGGAESCICQTCKNYAAQKPVPFPSDFLELLSRLGMTRTKRSKCTRWSPMIRKA